MKEPGAQELEAQRLETFQAMLRDTPGGAAQLLAAFAPGSMGCHEAVHTASVLLDMLERHLLEHPAIASRPDWYAGVARAHFHLFKVYQEIGSEHAHAPAAT